jgi:hypothetical protein
MSFDPNVLPIPDLGLLCPSCGYILAGLPRHRCPECGREFAMDDLVPPGDFPPVVCNGRFVHLTREIRELLRRLRIPFVQTGGGPLEVLYGLDPTPSQQTLGVPRESWFEVVHWLRRLQEGEPLPADTHSTRPDWRCPACREKNPGTFDICWKCAHGRAPETGGESRLA